MTKCICVWYWFIFLPYVSPFLKSWRVISIDVSTKHQVIKAERAQTKSGNGAIVYRQKLPSVEITLPLDIWFIDFASWSVYWQLTLLFTFRIGQLWNLARLNDVRGISMLLAKIRNSENRWQHDTQWLQSYLNCLHTNLWFQYPQSFLDNKSNTCLMSM